MINEMIDRFQVNMNQKRHCDYPYIHSLPLKERCEKHRWKEIFPYRSPAFTGVMAELKRRGIKHARICSWCMRKDSNSFVGVKYHGDDKHNYVVDVI